MRKIKILTDSVCDILEIDGQDGMKRYDLDFVPLYINLDNKVYKDGVDIKVDEVLKICEEKQILPKTSAPSVQDYVDLFKKYIDEDYDVVYMGIGSKLSSAFQSATIAAQEFEEGRVTVFDSDSLTSAIGITLIKASEQLPNMKSTEELVTFLKSTIKKAKCSFVIDSMEYLYKGGRCNALVFAIGSVLKIKPLIALKDGKLGVAERAIGKKNGLNRMLNNFRKDYKDGLIDDSFVLITHTLAPNEQVYIREQLIEMGVKPENIHESIANGVVASHCGRATIGIIYLEK